MSETPTVPTVNIIQSVAILIDGNNIERSLHSMTNDDNCMINFDNLIPKLLRGRGLSRLIYFREGKQISSKLADRLLDHYMGSVVPCHKSADIPLSICATQIARKVDTIIILSGDSDYVELLRHLKGEGVRIEIAAVKATTAQILVDEADHFIEITQEDSFSLTPKRSNNKRSSSNKSNTQRSNSSRSNSGSSNKTNPNSSSSSSSKSSTSHKSSPSKSVSNNSKSEVRKSIPSKSDSGKAKATRKTKEVRNDTGESSKSTKDGSAKRPSKKKSTEKVKSESDNNRKKSAPKAKSRKTNKVKGNAPKKVSKAKKKPSIKVEPLDDFSY